MGVSQGPNHVRAFGRQGSIGAAADIGVRAPVMRTYANAVPQAKQVVTIAVSDPGDDTDISLTINGVVITYNTGTGLSATQIAAGIAAAINAEALVRASVVASSASTTLTLTAKIEGVSFTVTESDAALGTPSTATANATAEAVPFGRVILNRGYPANSLSNQPRIEREGALAKSAYLTAQVITWTPTYVASTDYRVRVYEVRGDGERALLAAASEVGATSLDATLDALIASLENYLPANTVSAAADDATATAIVFTAEVAGFEFDVEVELGIEGASAPDSTVAYTTGPSLSTSLARAFAGISLYSPNDEIRTLGGSTADYGPNREVKVVETGGIWVETSEAITPDAAVYVELADGANSGKLFTAASSTRVRLGRSKCQWVRKAYVAGDAQAVVRVNAVAP